MLPVRFDRRNFPRRTSSMSSGLNVAANIKRHRTCQKASVSSGCSVARLATMVRMAFLTFLAILATRKRNHDSPRCKPPQKRGLVRQ